MGYYIFSSGINANQLKNIFGSKDKQILEQITENDSFQHYADFKPDDAKTDPAQALVDIIEGNSFDKKSGFAYGYAVIGICKTLGTELPHDQEIKLGYETDLINDVLQSDFNIQNLKIEEELLADNTNPFPIPAITDWPVIGLVNLDQLKELKRKLGSVSIADNKIEELLNADDSDAEEKGFAYEHLVGLITNIDYCIQHNLDMISFCH